jgi:hypothetical protein
MYALNAAVLVLRLSWRATAAVPREAIEDLYEQWNDVAEGFGVDKEESSEIFSVLQETLDLAKKPLASISDLLFDVYDTDNVRGQQSCAAVGRVGVGIFVFNVSVRHLGPLPR